MGVGRECRVGAEGCGFEVLYYIQDKLDNMRCVQSYYTVCSQNKILKHPL